MPDDWDSEAVDEVLAACQNRALARGEAGLAAAGAPALAAAWRGAAWPRPAPGLGRSRARAGVGIAETIDDLAALFAVLGEGRQWDPPPRLVCAIAEGWAEESLSQFAHGGCEDPLSGLATLPYLRTRLAEVYREAEQGGTSPADTHRLLVVGLPRRPDPWRRMALPILVGRDLRAAFPGGETLSLAKPGPRHRAGPGARRPAAPVRQAAAEHPGRVRHPDPHDPVARAAHRGASPGGRAGPLSPAGAGCQFEGDWDRRRRAIA